MKAQNPQSPHKNMPLKSSLRNTVCSPDGVSALFSGPIKELLQVVPPPAFAPSVAMSFVLNEFFFSSFTFLS